jgi:hypothetical protein
MRKRWERERRMLICGHREIFFLCRPDDNHTVGLLLEFTSDSNFSGPRLCHGLVCVLECLLVVGSSAR